VQTGVTITRAYTTNNALRVFVGIGVMLTLIGALPIARFLWFFLSGDGDGHVQSLILGGALLMMGTLVAVMGILADLIATNRKLLETTLFKLRKLEDQLERERSDAEAAVKGERADKLPIRVVE